LSIDSGHHQVSTPHNEEPMRGTLAVWCEAAAEPPTVELHFNIWSDLPEKRDPALDIGILFKTFETSGRLHLYIRGEVAQSAVTDLAPILQDQTTLSAIFNELVVLGPSDSGGFSATQRNGRSYRVILVNVDAGGDMQIEPIEEKEFGSGTILTFAESLFKKMHADSDNYIRLRISLTGKLRKNFMSIVEPYDKALLSSFYLTELVEFRINEARNFSQYLRTKHPNMKFPVIQAIHYFLVRKIGVELVRQHADFRKMRRLEPGSWENYLKSLGSPAPESMIIYHWRALQSEQIGSAKPLEDYVALTIFRQARANVVVYVGAIVLLGAAGSTAQSALTNAVREWFGLENSFVVQFLILFLLALILSSFWLRTFLPGLLSKVHRRFAKGVAPAASD
jgi:hypothetical protein